MFSIENFDYLWIDVKLEKNTVNKLSDKTKIGKKFED